MPKISDLPVATSVSPSDVTVIVQGGVTKQAATALISSVFNARSYGADPAGSSDSASAIQTAINAAEATGGAVYLPSGTYLIGSTLTIDSGEVTIYGDGPSSVLKMANGANLNRLVYFFGAQSATCHSLKFDGNRANQTTPTFGALLESFNTPKTMFYAVHVVDSYTDGISIRNGGEGYIEGCYIENIKLTGSKITTTDNVRVVNNTHKDCQTSINIIDGGNECMVADNTILGDGGTISVTGIVFTAEYTDENPCERAVIKGNVITGCGSASTGGGINVVSDQSTRSEARVVINGNSINECRDGILASNVSGLSVVGNVITRSDIRGISLSGVSDAIVVGNVLNEHDNHISASRAIAISASAASGNSSRISVVGNSITNTTQVNSPVGVYIQNSSQTGVIVAANQFSGCSTDISSSAAFTYTVTNPASDRAIDVGAEDLAGTRAVLGTLIADLQSRGIIQ